MINIANMIDPWEAIGLINRYEQLKKNQLKRVILYVSKQEKILKKFKDTENFFKNAEQSRSKCKNFLKNFLKNIPNLKT